MSSPAVTAARAVLASIDLSSYDPVQSRLMDERCILVDEQDNAIGAMDKKTCARAFEVPWPADTFIMQVISWRT